MTRLRGAILGCGMIAEYHLRAWQRIPEVEIVALCDPDLSRAESRKRGFAPAAICYASFDSLLISEPLDFIDILTPPWLHRDHCLRAADAGLHIICQKPMCSELADATHLVARLRSYNKLFAIHENHPYRPWFREIVRLKGEGFFGDIRHVALIQHDAREPPERFKAEAERGIMLEYGVHLVEMLRVLLGEPHDVLASFQHVNPRVRGESLATVTYTFETGSGLIDISWRDGGPELGSATVLGDRGVAVYEGRMTRGQHSRFRLYQQGNFVVDEPRCPTDDFVESFYLLQRELTDTMLNWERGSGDAALKSQSAANNLKTLSATFAAYSAAGRPLPKSSSD